ncbi:hypothetical protein [Winogradskyella aurantiaca]|uniref:hypothetical protein n=1 Tax=Winogradskyella aurantiaca TaxID=2219558 RepID=UPI000E1E0F4E|nr:hypothetical protein [Winogradskyella aurantiaca]
MKRLFGFAIVLLGLVACSDGDVITNQLIFSGELERCDNFVDEFLIYDINQDPAEALIFIIPRTEFNERLFDSVISEDDPVVFPINENERRFLYRTYNSDPDLCAIVDDGSVVVTADYEAGSGEVELSTSLISFDDDGIPTETEDLNLDGDNDPSTNPTDTDEDGIPDYLDQDDDGDNVPTALEDDNADGDNNPATNPRNTDGDELPDYLDPDDDGDNTPTIEEDENRNGNLFDDFDEESQNINTPRFLDEEASESFEPAPDNFNNYTEQYTTKFIAVDISLQVISYQRATFGTYITSIIISNSEED